MFKIFQKPKVLIKEKTQFKFNFVIYSTKHFNNGECEMWAFHIKEGKTFFLGTYNHGKWSQPRGYYEYDWSIKKSTERLIKLIDKSRGLRYIEGMEKWYLLYIEMMDVALKEGRKMLTETEMKQVIRMKFSEDGKKGYKAIDKKYNVRKNGPVRWQKLRGELSTVPHLT